MPGGGDWVGVKGELSLASPPPEGAGWREIAWTGFFGGLATTVGAVRGQQDGPGDAGCAGVVRRWGGGVASGRGRFETGPYERWGTSGGGLPGCEGGEESEEAGEHGGCEGGIWDRVSLAYTN